MAIRSLIEAAARGATRAPSQSSVDDLIKEGYPESVARRIASGELDMSPQARLARQQSMFPEIMYHGGSNDILNINTNQVGRGKTANTGFFAASRPEMASSYAPSQGAVYPLAVNTSGFDVVDAGSSRWNDITSPDYYFGGQTPATLEAVKERVPGMFTGDRDLSENYFNLTGATRNTFDTDELARFARRTGSPGLLVRNVSDFGPNASSFRASAEGVRPDISDEAMKSYLDNLTGDVAVSVDPNRVRSLLSAAFDPEYTGPNIMGLQGGSQSPSMLGSVASSAVGAASTASDSDEDKLYRGLTDKMVDYLSEQMGGSEEDRKIAEYISMGMDFLPFIGAAKGVSETFDAYKNDDKLGMALGVGGTLAGLIPFGRAAYKGGLGIIEDAPTVTRDTGLLQRVGDPESVNTMKIDVEPGVDLLPARQIRAEDLEGRGFVSGMADTSRGDLSRVVSINDNPVNMVRFGGQDYMRQPSNADQGVLWASDAGAVTGLLNAARAASDLPGVSRSPVYMPYQMSGTSTDFATMTADIMVPIAKRNMSKADKKALDKRIREGKGSKKDDFTPQPDWPGIDSPKADEWLASSGGNRKAITKAIDEFRDSAGINLSQARAAIVDPDQLNPRLGNLRQVGVLDLSRPAMPGSHPSYNTDIMGTYLGQLGEGASLFSDVNPLIRSSRKPFIQEMIDRGYDLSGAKLPSPVGKAMQPGLIGAFDQATLDDLIKKGLIAP